MGVEQRGISPQEDEVRPDYANEAVFRRNTLPTRSYYIPETSLLLNGSWDFHLASTPLEAPETTELDTVSWDKLNVPDHWQLQGYGKPWYTNVQFPIPICPPHVPTENPTGTYRRSFHVPPAWGKDSQLRLRFDGVDSAYHLYVNGVLVGYAQGSRNPSEFDVTDYLNRDAANEVVVRVYQWSDATYIEDQDQWWLSGIFRDVHLLAFPKENRIEDWFLRTDLDKKYENATLEATVDIVTKAKGTLELTLSERNSGEVVASTSTPVDKTGSVEIKLDVANPKKWTAETPNLYNVEISLKTEGSAPYTVPQRIGFRKVELIDGLMTVNGTPIRLRGVNRHEHHPHLGRAVPMDFAKKDLLLMKSHNINALRCSHQPNNPKLLDLCDELGLWVMDEADLECHGFYDAIARPLDIPEEQDYDERKAKTFPIAAKYTSDNPTWKAAYVDRVESMVQRDKNHTSIIMWSLGNEAFYGQNQKAMYEYAHRVDPGRLVHYEGDVHAETAEMYSYMYPTVERLIKLAKEEGVKDGKYEKPIILCEYAHAMGNGPGLLEDYEQAFRDYPRLQGGYIWEWANHGLWKTTDGTNGFYAYGGDFGDYPNDRTFVMDGLVNSKHEPTPGLTEYKKVIQPVGFEIEGGKITFENRYDFETLDHLSATYKLEELGSQTRLLATGTLDIPTIKAGEKGTINVPAEVLKIKSSSEVFLTVSLTLKSATSWAPIGHEIAWAQHKIQATEVQSTEEPIFNKLSSEIKVSEKRAVITVTGDDFVFEFDRARGGLKKWVSNGETIVSPNPDNGFAIIPSFWRPATDNDVPHSLPYWRRFGVDNFESQLRSLVVDASADKVVLKAHTYIAPPIIEWGWDCEIEYTVSNYGDLVIDVTRLSPSGAIATHLPRIGLNVYASKSLERVQWLGLGPGESYPDKKMSQKNGIWEFDSISQLHTPYDVPQENGNREETRWVTLSTTGTPTPTGIRITRLDAPEFSFAASKFSDKTIQDAAHPQDLVEGEAHFLRIDAKVAGVGTAACGPGVREDQKVKTEETKFKFKIERV